MRRFEALLQSHSIRSNAVGNPLGRLWLGLMNLLAVPVFVHLLGTNAFGIVGLVASIQSVLALLDFGLAGTANREIATLRCTEAGGNIADTVRTFEVVYWGVAVSIGLGIAWLSGWIGGSWLAKQTLPPGDLRMAITLGGVALAVRWPVALYTGILRGFERQVLQNVVLVVAATTRVGLAILSLVCISRTIYSFLMAQALANMMEALLTGYAARRLANASGKGHFDLRVVRRVWRFSVSFNLIGAIGSLVSGCDKLLISKLLPLVELTYYSVAGTATGALQVAYLATQDSLFPRLSACWQKHDLAQIRLLYLSGLRTTQFICIGPAVVLCFFPSEVLNLWARSPELTEHVRPLLPILAIAILANCANAAPLTVLLAAGHTRLPLMVNASSLPFMIVLCCLAIRACGTAGAALCWVAFNLMCFGLYGRHCFKHILGDGVRPLFWGLPFPFLLAGAAVGAISKGLMPAAPKPALAVLWCSTTAMLSYASCLLVLNSEERRALVEPLMALGSLFLAQPRQPESRTAAVRP